MICIRGGVCIYLNVNGNFSLKIAILLNFKDFKSPGSHLVPIVLLQVVDE